MQRHTDEKSKTANYCCVWSNELLDGTKLTHSALYYRAASSPCCTLGRKLDTTRSQPLPGEWACSNRRMQKNKKKKREGRVAPVPSRTNLLRGRPVASEPCDVRLRPPPWCPPPPPPPPLVCAVVGDEATLFSRLLEPLLLTATPSRCSRPPPTPPPTPPFDAAARCPRPTGVRLAKPNPIADSDDRMELCVVEGVLTPRRTVLRPAAAPVATTAGCSPRSSASSAWACARDLHGDARQNNNKGAAAGGVQYVSVERCNGSCAKEGRRGGGTEGRKKGRRAERKDGRMEGKGYHGRSL